jgi:hypothetical protein
VSSTRRDEMTNKEKHLNNGISLGLKPEIFSSDGWCYVWSREDGLILWQLASGDTQTAYKVHDKFVDHKTFSTLKAAAERDLT